MINTLGSKPGAPFLPGLPLLKRHLGETQHPDLDFGKRISEALAKANPVRDSGEAASAEEPGAEHGSDQDLALSKDRDNVPASQLADNQTRDTNADSKPKLLVWT